MGFVFSWIERLAPTGLVAHAVLIAAAGIAVLLAFILLRRAYRIRHLRRRDRRTLEIRRRWEGIVGGAVPAEEWRFVPLDRDIVETILLDQLEVAHGAPAARLVECLRRTGLLDMRTHEARTLRGWQRERALVSLGRMRVPEGIPALAEALDDPDANIRVAALRGLGRTGLPEAAVPILEHVQQGTLRVPLAPLQNALLTCCRSSPTVLLPYVRRAEDRVRPMLARVLGEVASAELDEDLLLLASDPLPDVRASAARALARAKPRLALMALANLAMDAEWYVRLRAVVALGELRDPRAVTVLVESLCDLNRHVRLRAAAALARFEEQIEEILRRVTERQDRYALQALVSELERSGGILRLVESLTDPARRRTAEQALLLVLRAGAHRLLLEAMQQHPGGRVRVALARLLCRAGLTQIVPQLERMETSAKSRREQVIARWLLQRLRASAAGPRPEAVAV